MLGDLAHQFSGTILHPHHHPEHQIGISVVGGVESRAGKRPVGIFASSAGGVKAGNGAEGVLTDKEARAAEFMGGTIPLLAIELLKEEILPLMG